MTPSYDRRRDFVQEAGNLRIRTGILVLYLSIPLAGYSQLGSQPFSITDKGATSVITDGSGGLAVGYARILPNATQTTPSGVAIFGERLGGILVSEAGVPASPLIKNGRIYAEVGPGGAAGQGTDIGLAIANPGPQDAIINFTMTNTSGGNARTGSYTLSAGTQKAAYLDQFPWSAPLGFQGTFSFSSNVGISVVALALYNNERTPSDALITTLPVIDLDNTPASSASALIPYYTDGSGWSTYILLVNSTGTPMTGKIQFRDATTGALQSLTANGTTGSSFNYTIAAASSFKLVTAGGTGFRNGAVTIVPDSGSNTPVPLSVFSYAANGITVTQAGVPSNSATTFRMYVEATPGRTAATVGSYSSGVAIANSTAAGISVGLELTSTTDGSVQTTTVPVPPSGVTSKFLEELFPALILPFQGVLRINSPAPVSVVGLRIRYNERNDFLLTTTPPTNEQSSPSALEFDFPQIVNGAGWTTQFNLFSGTLNQMTNGTLQFVKTDGSSYSLTINNLIGALGVSLASITPAKAAVGSAISLTGTGMSPGNVVVFTGASGTVSANPSAATSTSLTVTVPSTAITGPVFVQNGPQVTATRILEVTSASGTQIQSPITIGAAAKVSGGNIYVPPPALGLTFTKIGLISTGSAYSASAPVPRGAITGLFLVGSGFTAGTTVAVTGSGITLSSPVVTNGVQITISVTIDAAAAQGPRSVILTNSNGDTSILSGGLLIQ
jgi:hypothetical protein